MDICPTTVRDSLTLDLELAYPGIAEKPFPGMTAHRYACHALYVSLFKKFLPKETKRQDEACLSKFLYYNTRAQSWVLPSERSMVEDMALNEAKSIIEDMFFTGPDSHCTFGVIADRMMTGPGASRSVKSDDFYTKLSNSTLSASSRELHVLYKQAISVLPTWREVEELRAVRMGHELVEGSRLSFVPKTSEISRSICTEPLVNMLFQKGIGSLMEELLEANLGINLSRQPEKNQQLARIGSRKNGRFSTIDLTSASDSISISLCEFLLPASVMNWLKRCRSPKTILPDGSVIELHMIASMGNAFCFPLQTLIFSSLVIAAYRMLGLKAHRPSRSHLGNFGVFGDDIVVRSDAYDFVCRLLSLCGFDVNHEKSYKIGPFRESCGADYFEGTNVRGVYLKDFNDVASCYSAINRLLRWSARHRVFLPNTIGHLKGQVKFLPVPRDVSDIAGIKVPLSLVKKGRRKDGTVSYKYLTTRTKSFRITGEELHVGIQGWFENPPGILLAAVAGQLRDGRITPRSRRRTLITRQGCTPRWDYDPDSHAEMPGFGDCWKAFAEMVFE